MEIKGFLYWVFLILFNPYFLGPLVIWAIILKFIKKKILVSRWHHTFNENKFAAQDFFKLIEEDLVRKGLYLDFDRTTHQEAFLFGSFREYLRVRIGTQRFDICTAHVGSVGCYVSWRFFTEQSLLRRLLLWLPIIGWIMKKTTYHEIDENDSLRDMIHHSVLASLDALTGMKGSTLSEAERSIIGLPAAMRQT